MVKDKKADKIQTIRSDWAKHQCDTGLLQRCVCWPLYMPVDIRRYLHLSIVFLGNIGA
jgi:hypothetical protein